MAAESTGDYERIFLEGPEPVFIADAASGIIVEVNPAAEALLGRQRDEIIGLHQSQLHPPERDEIVRDNFAHHRSQAEKAEDPSHIQCSVLTGSGDIIPVEVIARQVTFRGKPSMCGFFRDMRERERLEQQHATERAALESQVRQRHRLDALGQLAGGVAHDFNNALACIMGAADLIAHKVGDTSPLVGHLRIITEASERAAGLTAKLLGFARHQPTDGPRFPALTVIHEAVSLMEAANAGRYTIAVSHQAEPCSQRGRPEHLRNALLSLLRNAQEASEAGAIITVDTVTSELQPGESGPDLRPGPYLQLTVKDGGVGMDSDTATRAFEPFFSTKPAGSGRGLGLADTYGLILGMGGDIRLTSAPGQGTTVDVWLPISIQPSATQGGGTSSIKRILLVDDDDLVRDMTAAMLESMGYAVSTTKSGRDAFEYVKKDSENSEPTYDMVMLDVVMPQMDGRECLARLRAMRPDLIVLLASSYDQQERVAGLLDKGQVHYLEKPFHMQELANTLSDLLENGAP
jgi:PAS domain S-box-containing protein